MSKATYWVSNHGELVVAKGQTTDYLDTPLALEIKNALDTLPHSKKQDVLVDYLKGGDSIYDIIR